MRVEWRPSALIREQPDGQRDRDKQTDRDIGRGRSKNGNRCDDFMCVCFCLPARRSASSILYFQHIIRLEKCRYVTAVTSACQPSCLPACLSSACMTAACLSVSLPVRLLVYQPVSLSACLAACMFIWHSVSPFCSFLSVCLSVCCLPRWVSVCQTDCLFVSRSFRPSVYQLAFTDLLPHVTESVVYVVHVFEATQWDQDVHKAFTFKQQATLRRTQGAQWQGDKISLANVR